MSVFETERLNCGSDDVYALHSIPLGAGREAQRARRNNVILLLGFATVSCVSLVLAIVAVVKAGQLQQDVTSLRSTAGGGTTTNGGATGGYPPGASSGASGEGTSGGSATDAALKPQAQFQPLRRLAFGSCSSYDLRPQPLWEKGVIPARPDAWVWVGDMAYLDTSPVDCALEGVAKAVPGWCNCTPSFMAWPGQCLAGNVEAARERWQHALQDPGYAVFLDYMCPTNASAVAAAAANGSSSSLSSSSSAALPGRFPPPGTDPSVCPRPIFGVWDDHDFGWNNGNRRLPNKAEYKRMFLDAVGEAQASPRRSAVSGLQAVYRLNGGGPGRDVDLVLLDERWYRDPLPCELRRAWCEDTVLAQPANHPNDVAWCRDFLLDDGTTGRGSCCTKDGDLESWCARNTSSSDPLWAAACDPTSAEWGFTPLVLSADNATLLRISDELWDEQQAALWPRLLQARDSPVCEVLGASQRRWLQRHMAASSAALTLVASGSVVVGSVGWRGDKGNCSDDDWLCWRPAQVNLLHTLANVSSGCVVVLTGDYHFGDIKIVQPGAGKQYTRMLQSDKMAKPVYQLMASGMTDGTAHHSGLPCNGTYREDLVGLRPKGPCAFTSSPNFGLVEVDWEAGVVHLTVQDADSGRIAKGTDGSDQHVAFSLTTCSPVPL